MVLNEGSYSFLNSILSSELYRKSQPLMQSCKRLFDACASHILDMKDKAFESTFIQPSLFYAALIGDEMLAVDADVHGGPTYLGAK